MQLYLTLATYTHEALAQITKNSQDRTDAVREAVEALRNAGGDIALRPPGQQ